MKDKEKSKEIGENFSHMIREFGEAVSKIFEDPKLKEKAKEFGDSASESAKVFGDRFKDEEVKQKFEEFGSSAKKFGESVGEFFKEEKKENEKEEKFEKKMNNFGDSTEKTGKKAEYYSESPSGSRIAGYSIAITWNLIFLIFFNFFYEYIAYYEYDAVNGGIWNRYTLVTDNFKLWLPILTISIAVSIIGNIILIINDRYYLRQIVNLVSNIFGIVAVATLLLLFPFDFSVIPDADLTHILTPVVTVVLVIIIIGLAIGTVANLVKLIVHSVKMRE
ncbi:MAG: hypothetical protein R6U35_00600 [Candidatus Humimicrobiaceae bacterium]